MQFTNSEPDFQGRVISNICKLTLFDETKIEQYHSEILSYGIFRYVYAILAETFGCLGSSYYLSLRVIFERLRNPIISVTKDVTRLLDYEPSNIYDNILGSLKMFSDIPNIDTFAKRLAIEMNEIILQISFVFEKLSKHMDLYENFPLCSAYNGYANDDIQKSFSDADQRYQIIEFNRELFAYVMKKGYYAVRALHLWTLKTPIRMNLYYYI
jgi:hypothetical protein